ncbi:histone deacetylase complex protein [Pluteus cervinus]|uniref:Histone deacetylase complex protein n=1 Tax=Pluteus cervinus TaxID=181527 RepID=A0ACD3BCD5_9AGAR|nr:histone deacetylase complex protein [Pluteus cervinus]
MAADPRHGNAEVMGMDVDIAQPKPATTRPPPFAPPPPRSSSVPLRPTEYTVGYVYSAEMTSHFSALRHPEQPERISRIMQAIVHARYANKMKWIPIREVRKDEALLVHSEDHWNKVYAIQYMTEEDRIACEDYYEQLSLYVMQGTTRSALLSCGGVIEACLAVARGELKKSFAIVRPPGHHAEPDEHMGFCFFNNVAVAARVVQEMTKLKRILILDWDVHHGNGTQRAFNDNPSILYMSIHRYEQGAFYPCGPFGGMQSCGEGPGLGFSVNVPWPEADMGDAEYIHAFQKVIMPIAMEFAPELVIISAGFDAAAGDDLGECNVTPVGYAHMTHMLSGLANGRMVVALEGGYNLDAISASALAVTKVILGEPPDELPPLTASEVATETVWLVAREQSKYWKSVDPKACEPRTGVEPISFSIPEILKAHRQHYLYTEHDMMQVPLMNPEQELRFSTQIMCTSDLFENNTLIFFVHEFGNLRLELEASATCDVYSERSYLIDFSKELITWIKSAGYSLLDANLFPKPIIKPAARGARQKEDLSGDVLTYLWDNYVQLSGAKQIILIGHGSGCQPLMDLMESRTTSVTKSVKGVIQVVGNSKIPVVPKSPDDLRSWYHGHSFVALPATHPILGPEVKPKDLRRHGHLVPIDEEQPVKVVTKALGAIAQFIKEQVNEYPENNAPLASTSRIS